MLKIKQTILVLTISLIGLLPLDLFCQKYAIIPKPSFLKAKSGYFTMNNGVRIVASNSSLDWEKEFLQSAFSVNKFAKKMTSENTIELILVDTIKQPEGYILNVDNSKISIGAKTKKGIFYGIQSLLQLASDGVYLPTKKRSLEVWKIPCVSIIDSPRFQYRGMHLDVARHFYSVTFIKKYIDLMAMHKQNFFHWHLTDDQGWRIEIKSFPKLTKKGAYRDSTLAGHFNDSPVKYDRQKYGGYYNQKEVKDIVDYASKRHITIIPEIEMPGHALAALASYKKLGCTNGVYKTANTWGVFDDVFCTRDSVFYFLENVLDEVASLFPGPYIHIGGDECPKERWKNCTDCQQNMKKYGLANEEKLQGWFINRIEKYLQTKGKKIIGWDEILEGGVSKKATIMSWRGVEGGISAAKLGNEVIMTPTSHCYLDYYQSEAPDEPLAIGGFLSLEKVYNFEPIPQELNTMDSTKILGCQGNVWTEYLRDSKKLEYMVFPRACALAEISWSGKDKNYLDFLDRLSIHVQRFNQLKVNYAAHFAGIQGKTSTLPNGNLALELSTYKKGYKILYTLDGKVPNRKSPKYSEPIPITKNTIITAGMVKKSKTVGQLWKRTFELNKTTGAMITLLNEPHPNYSIGTKNALVNGIKGNPQRYGDSEWLGWQGQNMEALLTFKSAKTITKFSTHFYQAPGQWIYLPKKVSIYSKTGDRYILIAEKTIEPLEGNYIPFEMQFDPINTDAIKIIIQKYGTIDRGKAGAGKDAWLFVDELEMY